MMFSASRIGFVILVLASVVAVSGCSDKRSAGAPASASADVSTKEGYDWSSFGGDSSENHYSALTQIDDHNIGRLGLAWSYDLPVTPNGLGAPLAIDGTLYFPVGHSVIHAMDAQTGKLLWKYDPKVYDVAGHKMRAGWGNRGLAYHNGKIYTGTLDGRLIAINAKTGEPVWSVMTVEADDDRYITGPPWMMNGKVVIGHGGADYSAVRGYITAYDAETGKQAWRFYAVPGDPSKGFENKAMEMAAKTWTGEWWKLGGGGTMWHGMAYDKRYNRLYVGTGNASPWNQKIYSPQGGDALFLCSIVALDADTGEYIWHYQVNPGETWDFNANMDIELADMEVEGQMRPVLLHAPKNGFFYVIDRENGKLISAEKFVKNANWAESIDLKTGRPVENPAARYPNGAVFLANPSPWGAHGVAAMSFNRKLGLTYVPTTDVFRYYTDPADLKNWKHAPNMSVNSGLGAPPPGTPPPPPGKSTLLAWDTVNAKPAWEIPLTGMSNGGTMTTAGNLLFQGQVTGDLTAYAADSGKKLWSFDAQVGVGAQPITYMAGGKQYVTVLAGWRTTGPGGMPFEWHYYTQKRRVLTFVLDGKAQLPPAENLDLPILDDASFKVDDTKAALGMKVFHRNCFVCHGLALVSGGAAPDLRRGPMSMQLQSLTAVLRDGALKQRGMPQFEEMPPEEIEGLQHYVRQQARVALAKEKKAP